MLPKITCDYPRDSNGKLITHTLSDEQYAAYHGLLGHYHVQTDKQDPGPALPPQIIERTFAKYAEARDKLCG